MENRDQAMYEKSQIRDNTRSQINIDDTQPMYVSQKYQKPKTLGWNIAALVLAILAIISEFVPYGTFIAIVIALVAIVISGVAVTTNSEARKRDPKAIIALAIGAIVLIWSCVKIGMMIAALATGAPMP